MRKSTTLALTALLAPSWTARAGPVTWVFTGEVTLVDDPNGIFDPPVEVGSPFSAQLTFDSDTFGDGLYEGAIGDVSGQVNGIPFVMGAGGAGDIVVLNDIPWDAIGFYAGIQLDGNSAFISIALRDADGLLFPSAALPIAPPPFELLDLTNSGFGLGNEAETFRVLGRFTGIVGIPEPTSGLLTLLALAIMCTCKRGSRRRRSSPGDHRQTERFAVLFRMLAAFAPLCLAGHRVNAETCALSKSPVDLVFLVDTSGSADYLAQVCSALSGEDGIIRTLQSWNANVLAEILNIGNENAFPIHCTCCIAQTTVATRYGVSIPGLPEALDDPAPPTGNDCPYSTEDWGPASAEGASARTATWRAAGVESTT